MNWKNLGVSLLLSMACAQAGAAEPWAPSDAEMASLPPYCKARMKSGQGSQDYKTWEASLGKDFIHTHHYCAGLNFINRYYRARSNNDKRFNISNAEGNLQYMVSHADPGYSLMPDVHLNLGVVYSLSNQPAKAIAHFNKAIELNPRQPRAYSSLADYYVKGKQTGKALDIVTEGLRHNPDTKSLQRRYRELGGKLPYPEAIASVPPTAPAAEASEPAASAAMPASGAEPAAVAPVTPPPAEQPIEPPKIGSPTNPYCRFCPD